MSGVVIAVIIIAVFFAAGVTLGVTMIVTLSVTGRRGRQDAWRQYIDPPHRPRPVGSGTPERPDGEIGYDSDDDPRPQWPDSGYRR